jgi:hypothetical protein
VVYFFIDVRTTKRPGVNRILSKTTKTDTGWDLVRTPLYGCVAGTQT